MRKPVILIHVDDRRRDAFTLVILAKLLRVLGNRVFLTNRASTRLYYKHLQPDVMAVPYPWTGVSGPEEFAQRSKRTRMIVLPTEGMTVSGLQYGIEFFGRGDEKVAQQYARDVTTVFMWGEAAKRSMGEGINLDEVRVCVVGSPRFDVFFPEVNLSQFVHRDDPPSVGFIGSFSHINVYDQRSVFDMLDGVRTGYVNLGLDGDPEEPFWWHFAAARLYLDLLDEWVLNRKGVAKYRQHPFEYFASYNYLERKYGKQFILDNPINPFPLWLASVKAIVVPGNTSTAIQAYLTGKPVISTHTLMNKPFPGLAKQGGYHNVPFLEFGYNPGSIQQAADHLEAAVKGTLSPADISRPGLADLLKDQLDWPRAEFSLSSVAREIDRVAREAADVNPAFAVPMNLIKANALSYGLRAALKLHGWKHKYTPGRKQVDELSRLWPWHRYEWQIGEGLFRMMLPKMLDDLGADSKESDPRLKRHLASAGHMVDQHKDG